MKRIPVTTVLIAVFSMLLLVNASGKSRSIFASIPVPEWKETQVLEYDIIRNGEPAGTATYSVRPVDYGDRKLLILEYELNHEDFYERGETRLDGETLLTIRSKLVRRFPDIPDSEGEKYNYNAVYGENTAQITYDTPQESGSSTITRQEDTYPAEAIFMLLRSLDFARLSQSGEFLNVRAFNLESRGYLTFSIMITEPEPVVIPEHGEVDCYVLTFSHGSQLFEVFYAVKPTHPMVKMENNQFALLLSDRTEGFEEIVSGPETKSLAGGTVEEGSSAEE
jgi:hypothetical protein